MYSTAVGYAGGTTVHPTYEETCRGGTGHVEVVQVVYDPEIISTERLLNEFWLDHRPVVDRSDSGGEPAGDSDRDPLASRDGRTDQYRSIILTTTEEQLELALKHRAALDANLGDRRGSATQVATQISRLDEFYYAEDYHQQYQAKRAQRYRRS